MTPRCPECNFSMGWTRYIRCAHFGRELLCEACSYAHRLYRNRYSDGLDPRRSAE